MSQNTQHLLLFFADQASHEAALRAVLELRREQPERSAVFQAQLGIDLTTPWTDDWFNHEFRATPDFVRLDYDTATSEDLPLRLLVELFQRALRAAVVEVFYSQVGETRRSYFVAGKQVNADAFYRAEPEAGRVVNGQLGEPEYEEWNVTVAKPISVKKLLAEQEDEAKQRDEAVQAIIGLAKRARDGDSDSLTLTQGALKGSNLAKGLLQALAFTVVTVLLFKGIWLWLLLGLVLAVVLPMYHGVEPDKPATGEDTPDQTDEQESTPC